MIVRCHEPMGKFPLRYILLVEDNEADIQITLRAFEKATLKSHICVVRDGLEALEFLDHKGPYQDRDRYPTPDLILLDIRLPKLNGFRVLKEIKSNPATGRIPVVVLTASKSEDDMVKSYEAGAASYITKPIQFEEFREVVEHFNCYWSVISKLPHRDKV